MLKFKTKVGDSIIYNMKYKQSDGTPINLTGYTIDADAYNKDTKRLLFNIVSDTPTENMYITTDKINIGEFSIIIKDTSTFPVGSYLVDIETTSADGFKQSGKTFLLEMVERL